MSAAALVPSRWVIEAADEARRRLERDLHDGAQQRFVTASIELAMAMRAADRGDLEALGRQLDRVRAELDGGLAELRDLARGIHPAVLGDLGLRPAVEALLRRSAVPATVAGDVARRPAPVAEAALYFAVAESLTNVAKHARADHAQVAIAGDDERAWVAIRDDGAGGADPHAGSGLRGLAERLEALGGELSVDSSPSGTVVHAWVPLEPPPAGAGSACGDGPCGCCG